MTNQSFVTVRFKSPFTSRLALIIPLVFCLAICANAQDRQQNFAATQEGAARGLIEAVVIEVQGTNLMLAGGIVIHISRAVIISVGGERLDASFKPGMCIRATIAGVDDATSALVAEFVRVQTEDRIVFSGLLQAADLESGHITLLNRRILITDETSIPVGFKNRKLKADLPVSVIVKQSGADLVATVIFPKLVLPHIFP